MLALSSAIDNGHRVDVVLPLNPLYVIADTKAEALSLIQSKYPGCSYKRISHAWPKGVLFEVQLQSANAVDPVAVSNPEKSANT